MKKLTRSIIGILFCSVSTTSSALDLKEAMALAQQYDTEFQAAYANYLAASEASKQTTAPVLPQVGFDAYMQRGETETDRAGVVTDSDNNADGYSLSLSQVIFDKTTFDTMGQGDATVAKAVADLEVAKQDTIVRVATAYFDVLTAIDTLETAISLVLDNTRFVNDGGDGYYDYSGAEDVCPGYARGALVTGDTCHWPG